MSKFNITVIKHRGYTHSECLREVAETLRFGLRTLGHEARILDNSVEQNAINVILGAHLLAADENHILIPGSIIYNLEQLAPNFEILGAASLSQNYFALAKKFQIWDYNPHNIAVWNKFGCAHPPRLVEIGYVPELRRIVSSPEQDIDVLFYGSLDDSRSSRLRQLRDTNMKVCVVSGVYGKERDDLIARSKIVLNLHRLETKLFEIVRVSYLLTNSKAVVSDVSPDMGGYNDAVAAFPPEAIVESCLELVRNDEKRRALERRGFEFFSGRSAAAFLSKVIPATPRSSPASLKQEI
jgi:hypothetical protein